jgi:phosphate transport system substrate-binding protein
MFLAVPSHRLALGAALACALVAAPALAEGPKAPAAASAQVLGAGATFPSKIYERWAQAFGKATGHEVVYKPTGSGDGIKQITARAVDFGGTDSPLANTELDKRHLVQLPMLIGGIVPAVNAPGIGVNALLLSGEVLADIMAGHIARWNDARIAALNPGLALPAKAIVRVVRADKSGTTDGFTRYLSQVSPAFKAEVGAGQLPDWPGEVVRGEGNDGVVKALKATEGAIAYVSYDRVAKDGLAAVRLKNADNHAVAASEAGFRAAIVESDVARKGDDLASLMNRPGLQAWPITLTSFALVDLEPPSSARAGKTLQFLYWCFMHGDELTRGTGFAPLPVSLQARLASRFALVKAKDGVQLNYAVF